MQKWSPELSLKSTRNIAIHLIKLGGNLNMLNQHLRTSQIYLGKPPLSLRGTLDALEPLYQRKSRLSLYTSMLRQQHAATVLSVGILQRYRELRQLEKRV